MEAHQKVVLNANDLDKANRNAITARYYQRNKEQIIRKKTLYKVRTMGRIPREKTLLKNKIERADVVAAMNEFLQNV